MGLGADGVGLLLPREYGVSRQKVKYKLQSAEGDQQSELHIYFSAVYTRRRTARYRMRARYLRMPGKQEKKYRYDTVAGRNNQHNSYLPRPTLRSILLFCLL